MEIDLLPAEVHRVTSVRHAAHESEHAVDQPQLLAPSGPFVDSTDENRPGQPPPYTSPPRAMFEPDLQP